MYKLIDAYNRVISMLLIRRHRVIVGKAFTVHGALKLMNSGVIQLGDHVTINSGSYFNPVGGSRRTVLAAARGATIRIGNHCGISNSLLYAATEIVLEDNVMIGGGCSICDTDFHPIDFESRIGAGCEETKRKPILIKEGAFVGMNSIILKGVTVGRHSVVGAGSVVTKDIPDNEIWAGNPAKFIKTIE